MRIVIAAVGRMKQGAERELAERFRKRAATSGRTVGLQDFDIVEIKESRAGEAPRRVLEEFDRDCQRDPRTRRHRHSG